jgi:hypothetical protein
VTSEATPPLGVARRFVALAGVKLGLSALSELAKAADVWAILGLTPDLLKSFLADPLPAHRPPPVSL